MRDVSNCKAINNCDNGSLDHKSAKGSFFPPPPLIYYVEARRFALVSKPVRPASTAGTAGMEAGIHNRHMEGRGGFNLQMQLLRRERLVCLQQVPGRFQSITFNNRFELSFTSFARKLHT